MSATGTGAGVELYWLPLGAGGHVVRRTGALYERVAALRERRLARALFHAALEVQLDGVTTVIEQAPAWGRGSGRDVVATGPVGLRLAGQVRLFRYEIRCAAGGTIPDRDEAVDSPVIVSDDPGRAATLLARVADAPTPTWGRDELGTGEMWNSNSLVSWLLERSGVGTEEICPPAGGRAPGWGAGIIVARRTPT